jgi:predicted RNase H-like HicB family nuclease
MALRFKVGDRVVWVWGPQLLHYHSGRGLALKEAVATVTHVQERDSHPYKVKWDCDPPPFPEGAWYCEEELAPAPAPEKVVEDEDEDEDEDPHKQKFATGTLVQLKLPVDPEDFAYVGRVGRVLEYFPDTHYPYNIELFGGPDFPICHLWFREGQLEAVAERHYTAIVTKGDEAYWGYFPELEGDYDQISGKTPAELEAKLQEFLRDNLMDSEHQDDGGLEVEYTLVGLWALAPAAPAAIPKLIPIGSRVRVDFHPSELGVVVGLRLDCTEPEPQKIYYDNAAVANAGTLDASKVRYLVYREERDASYWCWGKELTIIGEEEGQ